MKTKNYMRIKFPSRTVNESFSRAAVASFAATLDITVSELADIKTAVSEAVTNCIVHGYAEGEGEILVSAVITEDNTIKITVRDYGCGIENIERAMQPAYSGCPDGERSGLGFSVMKAFMDSVSVRSQKGRGTTVVLIKRLCCCDE